MRPERMPLEPLEPLLAKALQRAGVRAWIDEETRRAFRDPASAPLLVAVGLGRILRTSDLSVAELANLRSWLAAEDGPAWSDAAEHIVLPPLAGDVLTLIVVRDDAESVVALLGMIAMLNDAPSNTAAETRLAERLTRLDDGALAEIDELIARIHRGPPLRSAWLARVIALDAAPWWLDLAGLAFAARVLAAPRA